LCNPNPNPNPDPNPDPNPNPNPPFPPITSPLSPHKAFNSKLYFNRALAAAKLGRKDAAIADCTAAIDADGEYVKAMLKRAQLYVEGERFQEAINDLELAKDKDPSNKDIREQLHQAKIELKKSLRKNYYKILEITKDASENDVKKAYKKMALKHHPGVCVGGGVGVCFLVLVSPTAHLCTH
jgi:tetratricopeptide (TPR) repeat protein